MLDVAEMVMVKMMVEAKVDSVSDFQPVFEADLAVEEHTAVEVDLEAVVDRMATTNHGGSSNVVHVNNKDYTAPIAVSVGKMAISAEIVL